ncbi:ABC transporter ATP-binding protein [Halobacteriales archaeon QS_1_68_17]|nr:MAG: ABC transporter ATP-binding protein [Halobacteriales archaeon QS_1_68_17]
MEDVLVAEDLRRIYGETVALDGVSLTVGRGEVFALIGPNGAGKTTLVRALTGTTDASGTVRLFGTGPRSVDPARIGLLPQAFGPAERLTARELVSYYAGLYDDHRDPDAVLADVGMADSADTWYENLSGGQQRRTCVATALVNDPDLLVLDEPTTGIDPAGRRALWDLFDDLIAGGTSIVITTHYMAEAERLADRVGLLADGRLVAVDSPERLIAAHDGESRLLVGTAGDADPSALDRPARRADDGTLVVPGVAPEEIGAVVERLDRAGVTYESLTWARPDLEDVYLELTGRAVGASGDPVADGTAALAGDGDAAARRGDSTSQPGGDRP